MFEFAAMDRTKQPVWLQLFDGGVMYKRLMRPGQPGIRRPVTVAVCLLSAVVLTLVGCDDDSNGIRVYEVSKSTQHHGSALLTPPQTTPDQPGQMINGVSPLDLVQWTMPEAWHQENIKRQMILAVFHVDHSHTLEVTVAAFPGDVGGVLANVNRWRNQLSLEPITDAKLPENVQVINTQGSFGGVVDVTNAQTNQRTIATVILGGAGMSWFVKATGPSDPVGAQKQAIIKFTESFSFKPAPNADDHAGHDHTQPATAASTPPSAPTVPSMAGSVPAAPAQGVSLTTSDNWTEVKTTSPVIVKAYDVTSPLGKAQVTITSLNNDGGGLLPNINRWRNQLGLSPVSKLSDQPVSLLNMSGVTAMLLDIQAEASGEQTAKGMFMAIVSRPTETWYFKMTGDAPVLQQLKDEFITAVQSAQFAGAGQ